MSVDNGLGQPTITGVDNAASAPKVVAAAAKPQTDDPLAFDPQPIGPQNPIERFLSGGLFFMLIGCGFLWVSYLTMFRAHSSFSFILIVVGVAILLYGTGTQGLGQLSQASEAANYKIKLAGGAGVLAFCTAFGIVWKSEPIKLAFQIERKYLKISIEPDANSGSIFDKYIPDVTINGEHIASVRRGKTVDAYMGYFTNSTNTSHKLLAIFYHSDPEGRKQSENLIGKADCPIDLTGQFWESIDGGVDFPIYRNAMHCTVALQSSDGPLSHNENLDKNSNFETKPNASGVIVLPVPATPLAKDGIY